MNPKIRNTLLTLIGITVFIYIDKYTQICDTKFSKRMDSLKDSISTNTDKIARLNSLVVKRNEMI